MRIRDFEIIQDKRDNTKLSPIKKTKYIEEG